MQCGYSFVVSDPLAHKSYLVSASQEKLSITTYVAKKLKVFVFAMAQCDKQGNLSICNSGLRAA